LLTFKRFYLSFYHDKSQEVFVRTILATLLTVLLLLPVSAVGEIQTITHTVKQSFGGSQSPDDARISAVAKAKREALEKAGTYIESITVVKNLQVDKDEILALAAGVLKAEVVSQKNYASDDAFGIDVVVKVVVDTSEQSEQSGTGSHFFNALRSFVNPLVQSAILNQNKKMKRRPHTET
jgi:hypothetical protein